MSEWRHPDVDRPCDPECSEPCAYDCCCEFIALRACVHWRETCDDNSPVRDCEPPAGTCVDWFAVGIAWAEPPACVHALAARYGGPNDFRYELYLNGCGDDAELPDRIITSPSVVADCAESAIAFTREEIAGSCADATACGLCLPEKICLLVRATTGKELARCVVCLDGCDVPCSSSSSSSSDGSAGSNSSGSSSSRSSGSGGIGDGGGPSSSSSSSSRSSTSSRSSSSSSAGPGGGSSASSLL
jgi:hypothetical protein